LAFVLSEIIQSEHWSGWTSWHSQARDDVVRGWPMVASDTELAIRTFGPYVRKLQDQKPSLSLKP